MAKAKINLSNGTEIEISGTPEEVATLLALYNENQSKVIQQNKNVTNGGSASTTSNVSNISDEPDLAAIANTIMDCEEAEKLEKKVLDSTDVVNRILMCLYINEKYFNSTPSLTTGEISKILSQLGVPVSTANVSINISRKAKSYVMADAVRAQGSVVRYSLNRRGLKYFEEFLDSDLKPKLKIKLPKSVAQQLSSKAKKPIKVKKSKGYKPKYNASLDLFGIEDFIQKYGLKNNTEYLVAFLVFLLDEKKFEQVDGDDIYTCFHHLKSTLKIPGSLMDTFRNAQNREHVVSYEGGYTNFQLTPKGSNLFHHEIVKR